MGVIVIVIAVAMIVATARTLSDVQTLGLVRIPLLDVIRAVAETPSRTACHRRRDCRGSRAMCRLTRESQ